MELEKILEQINERLVEYHSQSTSEDRAFAQLVIAKCEVSRLINDNRIKELQDKIEWLEGQLTS